MASVPLVYDTLNLYVCPDAVVLEPASADPAVPRETLVILRDTGEIKLNAPYSGRHDEAIACYGVLGMIRLNGGEHLVIVTDRLRVGRLGGNDIFKMAAYRVLPLRTQSQSLTEQQAYDDGQYLAMLEEMLGLDGYYFSSTHHITHSLQRIAGLADGPMWKLADDRFFFNRYLASRLIDASAGNQDLSRFILPVICGFIEIRPAVINNKRLHFAIISRRSRHRVGTRYFSRGIDHAGRVSNYVETEQVLECESGDLYSYVQTRGSIPVFWRQVVNLKYSPRLVVDPNPDTERAIRRHFESETQHYGRQIAVNLVNKKGSEERVGDAYTRLLKGLDDLGIAYNWFDFHHECRNMKWHRISILLDQLENELNEQGYTHIDPSGRPLSLQSSVVRTNCMDCLDRTNVLQSVLGRRALTLQLREAGYLSPKERADEHHAFEFLYKNMWADHADAISSQYSGTGALKTDFTRTGRRTKRGLLKDGWNSAVRYLKNNFTDGARQDAFDLFVGNYEVKIGDSPFARHQASWRTRTLPYVAVFASFMVLGGLWIEPAEPYTHRLFLLGFGAVFVLSMYEIVRHGTEFVDMPKLVFTPAPLGRPDEMVDMDGKASKEA